jgi:hypothetical protein
MSTRKLINAQVVPEEATQTSLTIESKCPQKWAFVDMETGQVWVHKSRLPNSATLHGTFYAADAATMQALKIIVDP